MAAPSVIDSSAGLLSVDGIQHVPIVRGNEERTAKLTHTPPTLFPPISRPLQGSTTHDGPQFREQIDHAQLVNLKGQVFKPKIFASIQKGFFQVDGQWTCYRRNYFAVNCSFALVPRTEISELLYRGINSDPIPVNQFSAAISAIAIDSSAKSEESRTLVQHTPKRDKAMESIPGPCILAPLNSYTTSAESRLYHPTFYTWERIQFQKATANNGKRRALQQFFKIIVQLQCRTTNGTSLLLATSTSEQLVVRGRSPGHYKDSIHRDADRSQSHVLGPKVEYAPESQYLVSVEHGPSNISHSGLERPGNMLAKFNKDGDDAVYTERSNRYTPSESLEESTQFGEKSVSESYADEQDFDRASISSSSDIFSSSSHPSSASSLNGPPNFGQIFASSMLEDEGIKNLCIDGFSALDQDRFERHLCRCLKDFVAGLIHNAGNTSVEHIGRLLKRKVPFLAQCIRDEVMTLSHSGVIEARDTFGIEGQSYHIENETYDPNDPAAQDPSDALRPGNFTSIWTEIANSNTFEEFREGLLDIVAPFVLGGRIDERNVQRLQVRYSYPVAQRKSSKLRNTNSVSQFKGGLFTEYTFGTLMDYTLNAISSICRSDMLRGYHDEPGYVKKRWTCECGETIWVKMKIHSFEGHDTDVLSVSHSSNQQSLSDYLPSTDSPPEGREEGATRADSLMHSNISMVPAFAVESNNNQANLIQRRPLATSARYFELCVNTGQFDISLQEIDVSTTSAINSDGKLFSEIRQRYDKARSKLLIHKLGLFQAGAINYVQFCVSDGMVGILQGPTAIPNDAQAYDFQPCPMTDPPPVPASIFLHLLRSKRPHLRNTWLSRLPKKRYASILPPQSEMHQGTGYVTGWGVHIVEIPNGNAVFWISVAGVLFSLLFCAVYVGISGGDVQSAFAIGAFMIASQGSVMFAYFNYHNAGQVIT